VRRSTWVDYPVRWVRWRGEGDGAEGVGEGLRVTRGPCRGRRVCCRRPGRRRRLTGHLVVVSWRHAGCQCVLLHVLWRAEAMWRAVRATRHGPRPHVDGPGPRVKDGGPLGTTRWAAVRAALATAATTTPATITASRAPLVFYGGHEGAVQEAGCDAGGLLNVEVTSADGGV
jgi:hypothetical protein